MSDAKNKIETEKINSNKSQMEKITARAKQQIKSEVAELSSTDLRLAFTTATSGIWPIFCMVVFY